MIQSTPIILTDSQIKNLASAPIEIIPAQGTGKMILVLGGVAVWDVSAGFYTNIHADAAAYLQYESGSGMASSLFKIQDGTTNKVSRILPYALVADGAWDGSLFGETDYYSNVSNKNVEIYFDNPLGEVQGGHADNTLTVTAYYVVVDL